MNQRRKQYPFDEIEARWQERWEKEGTFEIGNPGDPGFDVNKPKYYVLDMFPYPSGEGLHVGHPEGYTATDIMARYKRMRGFNVLHPMGWDAFGLPAEQYAIKTGQHPRVTTERNVERFREQLKRIGFSYDWSREVNTTSPEYFKWTQWIFLKLYESYYDGEKARPIEEFKAKNPGATKEEVDAVRLAYVAEVPVNWCEGLGTVLANEEVVDGKSEVGGFPVERRPMRQWMLRITAYADRLIDELNDLDWPESIKALQRNWIGRSEGGMVRFPLENGSGTGNGIDVFTTRPDTLYGATYLVLAPEHPLVDVVTSAEAKDAVEAYKKVVATKSDLLRTELSKEKTGVFTGGYAVHPVTQERVPIWIADYVLMGYGTGAIMAVPGHDTRDFEFAKEFGLEIRRVVRAANENGSEPLEEAFAGEGVSVNSGILDGLPTAEAKKKMLQWLEENKAGKTSINYKLRDWLFSRQRYWGEPFPVVWGEDGHRGLDESELPVLPPEMTDFKPTGTAEPPLAKAKDWIRYSEQETRETNTMPQWAGSCWYYLRYCDAENSDHLVGKDAEAYWMGGGNAGGVDLYIGGTEHAVLHLLYARFWHKVLFDLGYVSTPEPFHKLVNQGLILGEDGQKMSKSRGNVVNPDHVIDEYGADALRLYEMFMGPLEQVKPWSMTGVEGVARFLARVWRLVMEEDQAGKWHLSNTIQDVEMNASQLKLVHSSIKKVTEDTEALAFNTAISQMMILVNGLTGESQRPLTAVGILLKLLQPFAPHLAEELWAKLSEKFDSVTNELAYQPWPTYEEKFLVEDEVEMVLQINGKLRDRLKVSRSLDKDAVEALAKKQEKIAAELTGKEIRKVIVVPGKLVNFVAT